MASHIFEEFKRSSGDDYSIWCHYLRERNGQLAKCKKCSKEIKCVGGSTGALHTHLKKMHSISILKRKEVPISEESPAISSSTKITKYFNNLVDDTLPAVLSRMTALDGLPFSVFCTSTDLRKSLMARGFQNIPKSSNTIQKLVVTYSHKVRAAVVSEFNGLKLKGYRASLTLDEWTSVRNRRFLNINVHSQKQFWSLGLVRVHGSLPAERCVEVIRRKLEVFGLCLDKDIVCITTDGAAVMKKVGKLIKAEQQLCLAHAIQLGVIKVLYKKVPVEVEKNNSQSDNEPESECDSVSESEGENIELDIDNDDDSELEDENSFESGFSIAYSDDVDGNSASDVKHETILPLITKIRVVVRLFRKSPTKNDDILQKYVKLEFGREYSLILDSKTRWNSLLTMLERFNKLKLCVQKALIDLSSKISFSEHEFNLLVDTISALLPVKLTVEALCRADANLLTADAALNFMLTSLNDLHTTLGNELKESLELRIQERRTNASAVLQFLHNGYRTGDKRSEYVFKKLGKPAICRFINNLIKRLSPSSLTPAQSDARDINFDDKDDDVVEKSSVLYMGQLLQRAIDKELAGSASLDNCTRSSDFETEIEKDVAVLEGGGAKSTIMELCYKYLLTIPPTSVESERAFSSSGQFVTKIRSRLNDVSINSLCFLRAHFNAEKNANCTGR